MRLTVILAISLILLTVAGTARSTRLQSARLFLEPAFKVRVTRDIVYGTGEVRTPSQGHKDLLLDLYEPEGDSTPKLRPAFVGIHGGGFVQGSKSSPLISGLCRELASRGYVAVSINYRLEGDDPPTAGNLRRGRAVRAAVQDATNAVRWLVENASLYRIDPARLGIGGSSAGAVTALRVAYGPGDDSIRIGAVVDLWGTMGPTVATIDPGDPAVIIIHGTEDKLVNPAGARAIATRAREVRVPFEIYMIEGAGHGVRLDREVDGVSLRQRLVDFLYRHLDLASLSKN